MGFRGSRVQIPPSRLRNRLSNRHLQKGVASNRDPFLSSVCRRCAVECRHPASAASGLFSWVSGRNPPQGPTLPARSPRRTSRDASVVQSPLQLTESSVLNREDAERDSSALLALFSFRRILDHQGISICLRAF